MTLTSSLVKLLNDFYTGRHYPGSSLKGNIFEINLFGKKILLTEIPNGLEINIANEEESRVKEIFDSIKNDFNGLELNNGLLKYTTKNPNVEDIYKIIKNILRYYSTNKTSTA